ncbi:MAG: cell division protein SepF [Ruminococcaceae bacterium]|nr:cell division protein SepF [Oscillospiraceae bacterium]
MKIKFTRKANEEDFDEFSGEEEYFGGFDENENDEAADDGFAAQPEAVAPTFGAAPVALKIVNPKGYSNATEIADYLMNGNTVLINIESMTRENVIRLLDYLSGAIHVIGGMMTKVGKTTIVVAPKNVDVSSIEAMVGSGN